MAENEGEVGRRIAILRRFRELLVQQRGKFERYLTVIDHEKADIQSGDIDALAAHVELEEQVVSEIFTFQKVIDPLDDLYRSAFFAAAPAAAHAAPESARAAPEASPFPADEAEVPALKNSLEELRAEVQRRNQENRLLLKKKMELVRGEIAGMRNPLAARKSIFAAQGEGNLVNIEG